MNFPFNLPLYNVSPQVYSVTPQVMASNSPEAPLMSQGFAPLPLSLPLMTPVYTAVTNYWPSGYSVPMPLPYFQPLPYMGELYLRLQGIQDTAERISQMQTQALISPVIDQAETSSHSSETLQTLVATPPLSPSKPKVESFSPLKALATLATDAPKLEEKKKISRLISKQCVPCDITFRSRTEKINHDKRNHPDSKDELYPCSSCEKTYTTASSLHIHVVRTHVEKKFKCVHMNCSRTFGFKADLNRHLKDSNHVKRQIDEDSEVSASKRV